MHGRVEEGGWPLTRRLLEGLHHLSQALTKWAAVIRLGSRRAVLSGFGTPSICRAVRLEQRWARGLHDIRFPSHTLIRFFFCLFLYLAPSSYADPTSWMAPELMAGEKATQAADVYSFGVLVYELANNADALPFAALSNVAVIEMVKGGRRLDVSEFAPPVVQELINQCTAMDRQQRPTFRWLARHLRTLASQELASAQSSADNHNEREAERPAARYWDGKKAVVPALPNLNTSHEDSQPLLLRDDAKNDDGDITGDRASVRGWETSELPPPSSDAQHASRELEGAEHYQYVPMETFRSSSTRGSSARGRDNSTRI